MTESARTAVDGGPERSDDAQRAALAWLDAHEADVIEFCKTFVRHPSVLTDECEVQERLVEPFLRKCRYTAVERASFDPTKERPNLMAVWSGRGAGRSLLFNGHCDVVPVYEHELKHRWRTDPFDPVVSDGLLIGRGAVDMKAGITAYLWAVRALQETGVRLAGDVVATVVVGEESGQPQFGCLPTMAQQIEARGKPDLTIVAEPTHAEIHAASGGFFGFEVAIQGREVHVSARNLVKWPQRYGIPQGDEVGVDALDYLRELLDRLERMDRRWARIHRDPLLGGGGFPVPIDQQGVAPFFVSVGRVEAGDWAGSVPGHARLEGGVIYPGWLDGDDIKAELRAEIDALGLNDPWLRAHPPDVQIATSYDVPPFAIPLDHPACAALSSSYAVATAKQPVLSGFKGVHDGCYMRHEFGVDVVTMGPGDLKLAHSANEAVPVDELLDCARTFACMAIEWCGLSAEEER